MLKRKTQWVIVGKAGMWMQEKSVFMLNSNVSSYPYVYG